MSVEQDIRRLIRTVDEMRRDVAVMREEWAGGRERLTDVEEDVGRMDKRVSILERWRWTVYGSAAAATIAAQPLLGLVTHK